MTLNTPNKAIPEGGCQCYYKRKGPAWLLLLENIALPEIFTYDDYLKFFLSSSSNRILHQKNLIKYLCI